MSPGNRIPPSRTASVFTNRSVFDRQAASVYGKPGESGLANLPVPARLLVVFLSCIAVFTAIVNTLLLLCVSKIQQKVLAQLVSALGKL